MSHILLYGPPGSGKTSIGRQLAENLGLPSLDLDEETMRVAGAPIPQIFAEKGEAGFRKIETATLACALDGVEKVIALGGGTLLSPENRALAEANGVTVCLDANRKTLVARLQADPIERPLLGNPLEESLANLLQNRASHYETFTTRVVTTEKSPEQVAKEIQQTIGRYHIRGMRSAYDVNVQGSYKELPALLNARSLHPPVALVTDEHVAPLYANSVSSMLQENGYTPTHLLTLPAGEQHKNLGSVERLWRGFLDAGLDRRATVVALGGGVVGDLAGFAASTFMRGVTWINLPTTLLAMVDASIGGKTGFDLPEGKNLVGSFYAPKLVLVNPGTLSTLPDAELRSGLAEVVKHSVIADPELLNLCTQGFEAAKENLFDVVKRAMAVKVQVVEQDPFEKGVRAALNFGHTFGHAIEIVSRYTIRHGEAVSIGMVAEARLAERLTIAGPGLSERLADALSALGLPVNIPDDLPKDKLIRAMWVDKKKAQGLVRFALPVRIGKVKVDVEVENLEIVL